MKCPSNFFCLLFFRVLLNVNYADCHAQAWTSVLSERMMMEILLSL